MTQVKSSLTDHTDRRLALLLGAVALAVYLRTVAPDVLPGDPGEFQFAAWRLGLAHATGYPLYLILGWLWQHSLALVGVSPAASLNALSAVYAALGVALLYLVMARWTPGPPLVRRVVGLYSALLLMVNLTYWSQALVAEVYAFHAALMLGLLWRAQRLVTLPTPRRLTALALLAGLALTHHALTLLWLGGLALYLTLTGTLRRFRPRPGGSRWAAALAIVALPLLLYAYIPLRSGPDASPWYHQTLGDSVLNLYTGGWNAFWSFLSGRSIGAEFRPVDEAWAQLAQAGRLWRYHFGWVGLAMVALGIVWLARRRQRTILGFTLAYALAQQVFNLFYAIDDILVYYIPLYVVAALWAGFGFIGVTTGRWSPNETPSEIEATAKTTLGGLTVAGWVVAGVLMLWAVREMPLTASRIDQSQSRATRDYWETVLAAAPPEGAALVSNDRNEIVPLFYLQTVENRGLGRTGLFPGLAPDARFANLAATLDTALAAGVPVYLIKEMPGLEIKYALDPATAPLVAVQGLRTVKPPDVAVEESYGPLHLLGYDLATGDDGLDVTLYWLVDAPIPGDYTATVQLLAGGVKVAQDDYAPGGVYLPTSTWRTGDRMVVPHHLTADGALPAANELLIGYYRADDLTRLAEPLRLGVPLPIKP